MKRTRGSRKCKKGLESRRGRVSHQLVDPTSVLMAQSNPPARIEILEDAVMRKEEHTTVKGFSDRTDGQQIGRETGNVQDVL